MVDSQTRLTLEWELHTDLADWTLLDWVQEEAGENVRAGYIFHFTSKELACCGAGAPALGRSPKALANLSCPGSFLPCGVTL